MTRPRRFLTRMILFLVAVIATCAVLFLPLRDAFMANPPLNGMILAVLLVGIVYNFRQVLTLYPEVAWIESFRRNQANLSLQREPRLLAPMATMLGERSERLSLSTLAMRSMLDGIASRLDESRDISRYVIGLLIFLGLLGTFWGLMGTIRSIGDVIASLTMPTGSGDLTAVFADLKRGLEAPLAGMGTAFSSSLFGLAGSLALGFLDLQASQAQNRFYNDLEEWLSSLTRVSSGALPGDGEHGIPVYVQALLEQTAESLENLQRTLTRGETERGQANANLRVLMEKLATLTDHMRTEQGLMMRLAESQSDLKPILLRLAESASDRGESMDEATRTHIRNMDIHVARLVEETIASRNEVVSQLRSEIKLLARTIAAAAGLPER